MVTTAPSGDYSAPKPRVRCSRIAPHPLKLDTTPRRPGATSLPAPIDVSQPYSANHLALSSSALYSSRGRPLEDSRAASRLVGAPFGHEFTLMQTFLAGWPKQPVATQAEPAAQFADDEQVLSE